MSQEYNNEKYCLSSPQNCKVIKNVSYADKVKMNLQDQSSENDEDSVTQCDQDVFVDKKQIIEKILKKITAKKQDAHKI